MLAGILSRRGCGPLPVPSSRSSPAQPRPTQPAFLVRLKDRSIQHLEAGGLPVGLFANAEYIKGELIAAHGDTFIGFTKDR